MPVRIWGGGGGGGHLGVLWGVNRARVCVFERIDATRFFRETRGASFLFCEGIHELLVWFRCVFNGAPFIACNL